jgi:hypothetical protein
VIAVAEGSRVHRDHHEIHGTRAQLRSPGVDNDLKRRASKMAIVFRKGPEGLGFETIYGPVGIPLLSRTKYIATNTDTGQTVYMSKKEWETARAMDKLDQIRRKRG